MDPIQELFNTAAESLQAGRLVKLTIAKPRRKGEDLPKAIYARPVEIKGELQLQFTYRYPKRDEAHNFAPAAGWQQLQEQLGTAFGNADLFTLDEQISVQISRKGKAQLRRTKARHREAVVTSHNRQKDRLISADRPYLPALGVANKQGEILAAARRKYKQINKFVEIIDGLVQRHPLPAEAQVVDMGAGSGYLTFALYDHLVNKLGLQLGVTGVELRPKLVAQSNQIAQQQGFEQLSFVEGYIGSYTPERLDVLIALHACDTATDDALFQGIQTGAELMIVAPCCQKQVRKDLDVPAELKPMLQHGILLERQAEMLTDTLRALFLEAAGYTTKVFEFIPLEHTAKNVMITAEKAPPRPAAMEEARALMQRFGVQRHYLLELIEG
ncbi:MAG: SAM-dependent methyltransferase [Bacteroidota bacterium]